MLKRFNNIVLIDDDDTINYYHNYMIEKCELAERTIVISDLEEAAEKLTELTEKKKGASSLILLDIKMPKYDGFEFLERNMQTFEKLSQLNYKLIILTSSGNPQDIAKSKQFPIISEYVEKPITEDILRRIQETMA